MSGEVAEAAGGEVATMPPAAAMMQVIARAAADPTCDVEKMERLFALQERMLARQAEAAFNEAMRAVQAEVPKIKRNKRNQQTNSNYADLEAVNAALVPIYTAHGLSLSFGSADTTVADCMRVTCKVSHVGGHSRDYMHDVPLDLTGLAGKVNKTRTHAFGSTSSYGRRFLTLSIFNVTTTDAKDDDGNGSGPRMSDQHCVDIEARCASVNAQMLGRVLGHYRVKKLDEIADSEYDSICTKLAGTNKGTGNG